MITIAHLLDDFGMGGVTRALTIFEQPSLAGMARSEVIPVRARPLCAPKVEADLIIDHMALSWKSLVFLASLRARHPKARIVHVEHSYTRAFEKDHVEARARFRLMLKMAAGLVDDIICVSCAQRDWLARDVGIKASRLRVIHPWTDREELFAVEPQPRAEDGPMKLLAYGRYAPVKNFAALIAAMRKIPETLANLTVFGDGPERARLEAMARDLAHVDVLGPSHSPETHLARCDAVIVPSRYEAFGLVAAEARMAARPILVAALDGLPEQVGTAGMAADLASEAQIRTAIEAFSAVERHTLGANGREEVRQERANIIASWAQLIGEVMRTCPASGAHRAPVAPMTVTKPAA